MGARARETIEAGNRTLFFSVASVWELAIKQALGKLELPDSLLGTLRAEGFSELEISSDHALRAGALPRHHGDPFDRMLVAQAQSEGLTLVSGDERMAPYGVPVLW